MTDCPDCAGTGRTPEDAQADKDCRTCHGTGESPPPCIRCRKPADFAHGSDTEPDLCTACSPIYLAELQLQAYREALKEAAC